MKKINKSKFHWTVKASFLFILAWIVFSLYFNQSEETQVNGDEVSILVDFGDRQRMFVGSVVNGMTLRDSLDASASGSTFNEFNYHVDNSGKVASIDGLFNNGRQWNYYINGEKTDKVLSDVVLGGRG